MNRVVDNLPDRFTHGLSHEDRFVRDFCLGYWENQPDRGGAQARQVINALLAYGMRAYSYPHQALGISLDRLNLDYLIQTLKHSPCFNQKDFEYLGRWLEWILNAKTEVVPKAADFVNGDEILDFEGNGYIGIDELRERVEQRLKYARLDAQSCQKRLESALPALKDTDGFPHDAVNEIEALLDRFVEVETPERLTGLAESWLGLASSLDGEQESLENADFAEDFKFGLGFRLAGLLRLASAADRIIQYASHNDWDWLNETAVEALASIPSPVVADRLCDRWSNLPLFARLYFSDIFAIAPRLEHRKFFLVNMRGNPEIKVISHRFARALATLGDTDSLNDAAEYWQQHAHDHDADLVAEALYAIYRLRGEAPPVLKPIRQRLLENEARLAAPLNFSDAFARLTQTKKPPESIRLPAVKGRKVGRNDPCPCGSGKKYKKCCL